MAEDKRYTFKIVSRKDASGKISLEFAWDENQGLGTQCHAAADALLSGKATDQGTWQDPARVKTVAPVEEVEDDQSQVRRQSPQVVQQRI